MICAGRILVTMLALLSLVGCNQSEHDSNATVASPTTASSSIDGKEEQIASVKQPETAPPVSEPTPAVVVPEPVPVGGLIIGEHLGAPSSGGGSSRPQTKCGNGIREAGELCDDGNTKDNGNGCSADCQNNSECGNGAVETLFEECDDGNQRDDKNGCSENCKANNICGNGVIESVIEQCDDGNTTDDGNGCSETCQRAGFCGNGIIESLFEECDYGGTGRHTPDCCFPLFEENQGAALTYSNVDDGFVQVPLSFSFAMQGDGVHNSAFVNTNGNVTFGVSDTTFNEDVAAFLAGFPRLGILWDDLIISLGGTVHFNDFGDRAVFTWLNVPEFSISPGSNTFQLQINDQGKVLFTYNGITSTDSLVGVTPGGGAPDPGETNYNVVIPLSPTTLSTGSVATSYELFDENVPTDQFDLDNQSLYFVPHSGNDGWDISRFQ